MYLYNNTIIQLENSKYTPLDQAVSTLSQVHA